MRMFKADAIMVSEIALASEPDDVVKTWIRTGFFKEPHAGGKIELTQGQTLRLAQG